MINELDSDSLVGITLPTSNCIKSSYVSKVRLSNPASLAFSTAPALVFSTSPLILLTKRDSLDTTNIFFDGSSLAIFLINNSVFPVQIGVLMVRLKNIKDLVVHTIQS